MKYKFLQKYIDKYGQVWVKRPNYSYHVIRICDGNVGGWFGGFGLTEIY